MPASTRTLVTTVVDLTCDTCGLGWNDLDGYLFADGPWRTEADDAAWSVTETDAGTVVACFACDAAGPAPWVNERHVCTPYPSVEPHCDSCACSSTPFFPDGRCVICGCVPLVTT